MQAQINELKEQINGNSGDSDHNSPDQKNKITTTKTPNNNAGNSFGGRSSRSKNENQISQIKSSSRKRTIAPLNVSG